MPREDRSRGTSGSKRTQVVLRQLNEMIQSDDRAAAARAMRAMLEMKKIDIEQLRVAYEGVPA